MCERPRFWRWLPQVLVKSIRNVPEFIGVVCVQIREPIWEIIIGGVAFGTFLVIAVLEPSLTLTVRLILAILAVPSFLIMMYGIYREDDC